VIFFRRDLDSQRTWLNVFAQSTQQDPTVLLHRYCRLQTVRPDDFNSIIKTCAGNNLTSFRQGPIEPGTKLLKVFPGPWGKLVSFGMARDHHCRKRGSH
jgi:hypothetical protein